jgi:class 3 adenylate cyclase
MRAHNEIVRGQVAAHGGHVVKCQGDSFMVAFDSARRGVRCAIGIQHAFDTYADKNPDQPIHVRVGLHTGEAIREQADLFGTAVIVAARIASEAKGDEILVSGLLHDLAEPSGEFTFSDGRDVELKGLSRRYVVHQVAWQEERLGG